MLGEVSRLRFSGFANQTKQIVELEMHSKILRIAVAGCILIKAVERHLIAEGTILPDGKIRSQLIFFALIHQRN
jgi:hypothetical protein